MLNTIQEVMRGLEPGEAQTVGNMTVIPLISDIVDDSVASPQVLELETQGYGTVLAYNSGTDEEKGLTISPLGNMIITKQAAQNHALPNIKVIEKGRPSDVIMPHVSRRARADISERTGIASCCFRWPSGKMP